MVITPACANAGEAVQVEGFGFAPNTRGPLRFIPGNDPANTVAIGRDNVETDDAGHFLFEMTLPKRPSEDAHISARRFPAISARPTLPRQPTTPGKNRRDRFPGPFGNYVRHLSRHPA